MRQLFAGLIVGASVAALTLPAFAATQTITGQLIDASCYKDNKSNIWADHEMPDGEPVAKDCAVSSLGTKTMCPLTEVSSVGAMAQDEDGVASADVRKSDVPV